MALPQRSVRTCCHTFRNTLALIVALGAGGFGLMSLDPMSVGSEPQAAGGQIPHVDMTPLSTPTAAAANHPEEIPGSNQAQGDDPQVLRGLWAMKMTYEMLKKGTAAFEHIPDYTSTMFKQERIGGSLTDNQEIELKVKHAPFSVYMKWHSGDRGRQLIYVDGKNDGKLLVQPGGIKGRLTGVLHLEPESHLALSESRYPVTKAGLAELAKIIMEYQAKDLERGNGFNCILEDGHSFDDRPCYLYVCEYDTAEINPLYRKSTVFVDKDLSMPVCVKNFTWGRDVDPDKIDEETLIECYSYTKLRTEQNLPLHHWAEDYPEYKLRVRK